MTITVTGMVYTKYTIKALVGRLYVQKVLNVLNWLVGLLDILKVGCRDVGMLGCWDIWIFGWLDDWFWIVRYLNGKKR